MPVTAAHLVPECKAAAPVPARVVARLDAAALKQVDAAVLAPRLLDLLQVPAGDRPALCLIVAELFNNALEHGVLRLESALKRNGSGMSRYLELRRQRLARLRRAAVDVTLERRTRGRREWLRIRVRDSGAGFDFARLARDAAPAHAAHGRGLALIGGLGATLTYRRPGNEAVARYELRQAAAS